VTASPGGVAAERSLVSVILPVLNEAGIIARTLESLLRQDTAGFDLEILVIDAMSSDTSREIVARTASEDPRVRLLSNERRTTPAAFNLGLHEARGQYVAILGSHNIYDRDYVRVCLSELRAKGAVGCTGRTVTRPARPTLEARLVAWALGHPFGTSRRSFRTQPEGYVDTAAYPVMIKDALLEAGGYDEGMLRNQDNDMNQRLRVAGHRFYCTWKTQCLYHPQATLRGLAKYAFRSGYWNAISLRENPASMRARHLAPLGWVLSLFACTVDAASGMSASNRSAVRRTWPVAVLLGLHMGVGTMAGLRTARRERAPGALWLPFVFAGLHITYGVGTLWGLLSNAQKTPSVQDRAG
jgi:succinoglycan biosynthesis protein ExoA